MSVIQNEVMCAGCGASLQESQDVSPAERQGCPHCGSRSRNFGVEIQEKITLLSSMKASGVRAGMSKKKGWFKKIFSGQVIQYGRQNKIADVERILDRSNDRYTEVVRMKESGEVVHLCDEPLSAHHGHGGDRKDK